MDGILAAFARVNVDEKLMLQILTQPLTEKRQKRMRRKVEQIKNGKETIGSFFAKMIPKKHDEKEDTNDGSSQFSSTQTQDIENKAEDE